MKYGLIAIDLDGTLLENGKVIPDDNIKAVRYAASKGVHVVIATGRVTTSGKAFAKALGIESYIISSNGARIYDLKRKAVIFEDGLAPEDAKRIAGIFEKEGVYYHSYVDDIMYARYMREQLLFYTEQNKVLEPELRMDIRICEDYDSLFDSNTGKISKVMTIENDPVRLASIRKQLSEIKRIVVMSSQDNNIEVMNYSVSKGNALARLAEIAGLKREEVMAIGDNDNDLSMIEWAGMGVAMGNAIDEVKQAASYVTDTCENAGVAKAIYKFI